MSAPADFSRALVVDDLSEARQWMVAALQAAFPGMEVATAANLREAFARIEPPPQLALIDLGLPDGNGTQLIEALRSRGADTLCIVSTVFDDDAHLFPALRAGAQGYVLKDRDRDALAGMLQRNRGGPAAVVTVDRTPPVAPLPANAGRVSKTKRRSLHVKPRCCD